MQNALILCEDARERRICVRKAEFEGYSAETVDTFDECERLLSELRPTVLMVDGDMQGGSLVDLLVHLPSTENCQIIYFSSNESMGEMLNTESAQHLHFLPRPLNKEDLRAVLRRIRKICPDEGGAEGSGENQFEFLVGDSEEMRELYHMIAKVGPTDASVLICGASGTGKELVASSIHSRSERSEEPFIPINCGAIPENLIESELFGHEKGAFTGAEKTRKGVFERADGGTLFLDEITEMPAEMQVRLLRVLEDGKVVRVGSDKQIEVDVRVIAATNRNTNQAVEDGKLREDLLYRLAVFPIHLPSLSERGSDVILLANHFLSLLNKENETEKLIGELGKKRLKSYEWPGNVRQLRNMVHRAYILEDHELNFDSLVRFMEENEKVPDECGEAGDGVACDLEKEAEVARRSETAVKEKDSGSEHGDEVEIKVGASLEDAEREMILSTLKHHDGNKTKTAETLGISVKTLYNRLKEYNLPEEE